MSDSLSRVASLTFIALGLFITGCEVFPVSQHPLSDEANSQVDDELIGMWDLVNVPEDSADVAAKKASNETKPAEASSDTNEVDEERPPRFALGKIAGKERVHELAGMRVNEEGLIELQRFPLYAIRVGPLRCVSLRVDPTVDSSDYVIARYARVNANRILFYPLDREFITAAIGRGELKGIVKKAPSDDPNAEPQKQSIRITAGTEELRDFLIKHEKKAFSLKPSHGLQRAAGN